MFMYLIGFVKQVLSRCGFDALSTFMFRALGIKDMLLLYHNCHIFVSVCNADIKYF